MSTFEAIVFHDDFSESIGIGEFEEFPEAAKMIKEKLDELEIHDYSIISLKAVDGEYKGKEVKGENLASLFITKEEILEALQNGDIGIGYQDDSITAYMADNYFYFDSEYINEVPEGLNDDEIADLYLKEHTSFEIAEKIHECLKDFAVEFPMEYWSYKLYLTNDNADKTIKINDFEIASHKHDFELTEK